MENKLKYHLFFILFLGLTFPVLAFSQSQKYGILNSPAPSLNVDQWINLADGKSTLEMSELKGKVVYFYNFQTW